MTKQEGWKQVDEGITWFKVIYPRVKSSSWPEEYKPVKKQKKLLFSMIKFVILID